MEKLLVRAALTGRMRATRMTNVACIQRRPFAVQKGVDPEEVHEGHKAVIEYVRVSKNASAPHVGSEKAAGADLCAAEDCIVPAGDRCLITTGLRIAIPEGYYGRVAPRSGLAVKHFIDVGAGVVDADYRGELKVLLFNFGKRDFEVKIGDRIAQIICEKIAHPVLKEVKHLGDTERGSAGFGSTGVGNTNS